MSTPNALTYNQYIAQIAAMAVYQTVSVGGVTMFLDAPPQLIVPQMLNYAELRIQRDLDLLASTSANTYTATPGQAYLTLPVEDFFTISTLSINDVPLLPVSREFIQNCYAGQINAGMPQYFAMVGDNFGDGGNVNNNILLGPPPNYPYSVRVSGTIRQPSLYTYAAIGVADTETTWISTYLPDMLIMASMIYISAFQRNFSATSDSADMGQSYEKQYQALRLGAISDEGMRKFMGRAWSAYATPTSATPS